MNNSNAKENTITNILLEDVVASEVDKTLGDDQISDVHVTVCTSPPNDDDEPISVVGVGPVSTNPITEHEDLPNNTQTNLCDGFRSRSTSIDEVSAAITVSTLSGNSTMVTNPATPPPRQNMPQSRRLNYPDCMDASHATTVEGATLATLSPGTSSSVPRGTSRRRINLDNSRDTSNGSIDDPDGESNFCGYDSDGEVGPFYNAVSEELGIQDEAIFDHEPPPPAPLSPSEVIPENPR